MQQIKDNLEYINERLVLLSIDTSHLSMALQAVQTDDPVSKGVVNAIMTSLFSNVALINDLSEQTDGLLSLPQMEVIDYE